MTTSTLQAKALCVVWFIQTRLTSMSRRQWIVALATGAMKKSLTLCWHARILPGVGHIQFPLISYVTNFSTAYLVASLDISPEYYVTSEG
jgi:hypothetical protein